MDATASPFADGLDFHVKMRRDRFGARVDRCVVLPRQLAVKDARIALGVNDRSVPTLDIRLVARREAGEGGYVEVYIATTMRRS